MISFGNNYAYHETNSKNLDYTFIQICMPPPLKEGGI